EILRKFGLSEGKSASTPIDAEKPLLKDSDGEAVDVHTYMSMIGSLMYLTSSRPDIMFAVCACARFQVTPKISHLNAVKRIFRYLKGKPCLGLWYPKDSPFDLVAYSNSDYVGASLDRKSTTEGYQFLGCRLISWQCKKQTVVATSSIEAEYVAAASGCAQVPWMQNQLLDYGENDNCDSPLLGVNTPRSDEDRLKLMELMFWNTDVVKRSGDVTRLQALVDKKRIVITEKVVREILQLNDDEGVSCLPNEEIFAGLARMGYEKPSTKLTFYKAFFSTQWKFFIHTILHSLSTKRTLWNEFSSEMASALICLSSGQRFNFSKYIFESLVHNVDSSSKFYMIGKGFSGVEIPLFESMLAVRDVAEETEVHVPAQGDDVQEHAAEEVATNVIPPTSTSPSPSSPVIPSLPPHQSPCPPQPQDAKGSSLLFQRVLDTCSTLVLRVEGLENDKAAQQLEIVKLKERVKKLENINDVENVFNQGRMIVDMDQDEGIELVANQEKDAEVLSMQEDDSEVQEAVEVVTTAKLMTEVVTAAVTQVAAASTPIPAAKPKTLTITAAPTVSTRRRKEVVIRDPEEELQSDTPAETLKVKEKGKGILIEAPKPMKKKDQIEIDSEYARKLQEEINKEHEEAYKNIDWNAALDHVQSKEPQYIKRYHGMKKKPQTESKARKNMIFYLKNTKGYKMDFFKGKKYDEILLIFQAKFDANMNFLFKSREEMEKEDEEIIKSINETPAQKATKRRKLTTPLAQKVPVVDYQIVVIDNKPKYPLLRFTLEHLVNVTRLQVEEESEMSLELLRSKKNSKCVSAANEELTAAKHKLMLLI
nr:uncharacterized mitochondrial protein AtMg00810-like [Tanacetum cinerariifolium]